MHTEDQPTLRSLSLALPDLRPVRRLLLLGACSCALLLAGCGGGGDTSNNVTLGINAVVGGQAAGPVFVPGTVGTMDITAGQTIQLDANEPVEWAFSVDGSPLFSSGTTVYYGGLAITESAASPSRVVLDTAVTGPYASPINVVMTATSTMDATEVATVNIVVH